VDDLVRLGFSNAVAATFLALIALIVGRTVRRPALTHALWLLVLLKLITPPLRIIEFEWPLPPEPVKAASPGPREIVPLLRAERISDIEQCPAPEVESGGDEAMLALDPEPIGPGARTGLMMVEPTETPSRPAAAMSEATLLGIGWLAGSVAWLGLAIYRTGRFRRVLRHAQPAPIELQREAKRLARQLGLSRCPGVWLVPGRVSPMLWALSGKPRLVLPSGLLSQLSDDQRAALLLHELAHLRRGDHWTRGLEIVTACLYWWHPVLWLARRELREAEEQCCDAWVVWALPGSSRNYALALVETLDFLSQAPSALPVAASGMGRVHDLRRRLTMIMRGTTPRQLSWRGVLLVAGVAAALLPMLPTLAQSQAPGQPAGQPPANPGQQERRARAEDERARAEIQRAEADLARAREQLAEAEDRLQQRREQIRGRAVAQVERRDGERRRMVVIIQDQDGRELRRIEARPGQEMQIRIPGGDGERPDMRPGANPGGPPGAGRRGTPPPGAPGAPRSDDRFDGPRRGGPGGGDQEQRLQRLERRLDEMMRALEQMRNELRQRGPETPRSRPPSGRRDNREEGEDSIKPIEPGRPSNESKPERVPRASTAQPPPPETAPVVPPVPATPAATPVPETAPVPPPADAPPRPPKDAPSAR
jgi:beta-lactamase regulating signal transducer with metallopeptidase domain